MTVAPSTLVALQNKLVTRLGTTNLGIVGDDRHVATGGYHIGAMSLRKAGMGDDYSLTFALDSQANHDYACAIDIGGGSQLLMTLGTRIVHALKNHDPRVYGKVRAVNAPFDGTSIDRRYDAENPNTPLDDNTQASDDRNHIHIEFYRTLVLNQSVMDDFFDVMAGVVVTPAKPVTPAPVTPSKGKLYQGHPVPTLLTRSGHYLGLITGPPKSHGGFNITERPIIKVLQQRLIVCGFVAGITNPNSAWVDGLFENPTAAAVTNFQKKHMPHTKFYGQVWADDWRKLFNL